MNLGTRFLWLVALPTCSCLASWAAVLIGHVGNGRLAVAGFLPLIGLTGVLAYRWFTRDVRLVPYIPFAAAAVVYAVSMTALAVDLAREPDGAVIPLLQFGLGFLLPFIAFGCGLAGFILVRPRSTP